MYKALYRKYRSRTFDEMVGQKPIIASLKNQVINNEISHAYLFSGIRGTGKTSAAKILSRAINCKNPVDGNPCNSCENCLEILNDISLDVIEMDAASNNGVDDIRELKEKVVYPPTNLKYKVYIIDEVHMLSKGAFNALLKVLEEPPSHLVFILATTEIEKIPQTILSRTLKYNFKRIETGQIVENLKQIAKCESKSCDEEVYRLIAKNSDGAMRDAISLFDQVLSISKDHVDLKSALMVLGISDANLLCDIVRAFLNMDVVSAIEALERASDEGKDMSSLSRDLIKFLRDLLLYKNMQNSEKFLYFDRSDLLEELKELENQDIFYILNSLKEIQADLRYSYDPKIFMEMGFVSICKRSGEDLNSRVLRLEKMIEAGELSAKKIIKPKSSPKSKNEIKEFKDSEQRDKSDTIEIEKTEDNDIIENELNLQLFSDKFKDILDDIGSKKRYSIKKLLADAEILEYKNGDLELGFAEEFKFNFEHLNTEENKKFIEGILKDRFDRDIGLKFKMITMDHQKLYDLFGKENIQFGG